MLKVMAMQAIYYINCFVDSENIRISSVNKREEALIVYIIFMARRTTHAVSLNLVYY